MDIKLIAAALASLGMAACSPDVTPPASTDTNVPAASSAPAQPPAAPVAQEEKKDEGVAPAPEAKTDEGEKNAD